MILTWDRACVHSLLVGVLVYFMWLLVSACLGTMSVGVYVSIGDCHCRCLCTFSDCTILVIGWLFVIMSVCDYVPASDYVSTGDFVYW